MGLKGFDKSQLREHIGTGRGVIRCSYTCGNDVGIQGGRTCIHAQASRPADTSHSALLSNFVWRNCGGALMTNRCTSRATLLLLYVRAYMCAPMRRNDTDAITWPKWRERTSLGNLAVVVSRDYRVMFVRPGNQWITLYGIIRTLYRCIKRGSRNNFARHTARKVLFFFLFCEICIKFIHLKANWCEWYSLETIPIKNNKM